MSVAKHQAPDPLADRALPVGGDDKLHALEILHEAAAGPLDSRGRDFLSALFTKYRASLFRYLVGLVKTTEDAAELVQETYARIMQKNSVLHLEVVARTYLFQTAKNLARDHYRRQQTHHAAQHVDLEDEVLIDDRADPAETFAWSQTLNSVKQGIKDLPPLTRRVFLLSRFRHKTYPQIAELLGVSTRTVERKMSEAMTRLAIQIGEPL